MPFCFIVMIQAIKKVKNDESYNENAVIIFEKTHLSLDQTKAILDDKCHQDIQLQNDIYNKFSFYPSEQFNSYFYIFLTNIYNLFLKLII